MPSRFDLDYELPPSIRALQASWQGTFQSAATVAALLAAIESQLFVFVKSVDPGTLDPSSRSGQALLFFTYFTFFISIATTLSSLILNVQFGKLERQAGSRGDPVARGHGSIIGPSMTVLKYCGMHKHLEYHIFAWALLFVCCCISLVAQVLIYVWATESRLISIMISVSIYGMSWMAFFPFISGLGWRGVRDDTESEIFIRSSESEHQKDISGGPQSSLNPGLSLSPMAPHRDFEPSGSTSSRSPLITRRFGEE